MSATMKTTSTADVPAAPEGHTRATSQRNDGDLPSPHQQRSRLRGQKSVLLTRFGLADDPTVGGFAVDKIPLPFPSRHDGTPHGLLAPPPREQGPRLPVRVVQS